MALDNTGHLKARQGEVIQGGKAEEGVEKQALGLCRRGWAVGRPGVGRGESPWQVRELYKAYV